MNADNFAQYLEDPSLLYQASYQELKSLALQYPYCQNLHLLLFQKSYMDGSLEWESNLEKAAVYSIDRKFLYHQVQKLDKKGEEADNFLLSEEFLELKSLDSIQMEESTLPENSSLEQTERSLQLEFGPTPPEPHLDEKAKPAALVPNGFKEPEEDTDDFFEVSASIAPPEDASPGLDHSIGKEPKAEKAESASDGQPALHTQAAPPFFQVENELIEACTSLLHVLALRTNEIDRQPDLGSPKKEADKNDSLARKVDPRPPLPSPELAALKQKARSRPIFIINPTTAVSAVSPKPQPKQSFTSWIEQFQSANIQVRLSELMESKKLEDSKKKRKKKRKRKKAKASGVGRLALRSITENKEILSETLAELLADQGEYSRAIKMYQALMLVFPQKSDFFAEKIENLKRK